jgi:hypothetical protein
VPQASVAERPSALPPVFAEERVMPPEELYSEFSDQKLLRTMRVSANDAHYIACRTVELIEQTRSILRELEVHGIDGRRIS